MMTIEADPQMADDDAIDSQALTGGDITRYRPLVARISYLSQDLPHLKFASMRVCCAHRTPSLHLPGLCPTHNPLHGVCHTKKKLPLLSGVHMCFFASYCHEEIFSFFVSILTAQQVQILQLQMWAPSAYQRVGFCSVF